MACPLTAEAPAWGTCTITRRGVAMTTLTRPPRRVTPRLALVLLAAPLLLMPAPVCAAADVAEPPVTRTDEVVDDLFGVSIPDPYRWLEDGSSAEARTLVDAQNAYTRGLLDARPARGSTRDRP